MADGALHAAWTLEGPARGGPGPLLWVRGLLSACCGGESLLDAGGQGPQAPLSSQFLLDLVCKYQGLGGPL